MLTIFITILSLSFNPQNYDLLNYNARDTFGYYWLDSDTNAPGAPVFNWVSIYSRGTRITGLADDNVKGPFPIGFNFPFYWEKPNSVFISSNGYVSFDDNFLSAYPFQSLPSIKRPDNILAPLMSDLDFTIGTPSVWFWTNTGLDTFIVEFDSVQFWSTGGLNSFQIILSRQDSSITFQYLRVNGEPQSGWLSSNSNSVGIENNVGRIGIQYLKDGLPLQNQLHDSLAIKFFCPCSSSLVMHDMKVFNVLNEYSGAIFVTPGDSMRILTKTKNSGNQVENYVPVYTQVKNDSGNQVYNNYIMLGCRLPGMIDSITFTPAWVVSNTGRYCLKVKAGYTFDMCPNNDTVLVEIRAVNYPTQYELQYDDEPNSAISLNKPGCFANQFVPPHYPWFIRGARIYASAPTPTNVTAKVFDDNGPGNSPGDVLAQADMTVSNPYWYFVQFPDPIITIDSGAFFIGATSSITNLSYGIDTIPPFSHRLWEYTGTWNLSRFSLNRDVCIRSLAFVGIEELTQNPLTTTKISILPNPFRDFAKIQFQNPLRENKTIRIYNSMGVMVRALTTNEEMVIWNGRNENDMVLPNGCYFVRFSDNQVKSLAKVIIAR